VGGSIFGAAGAGLTGYKMARRTRGLRDFSFERCCYDVDKLSVVIMISGWMQCPDDDKRTYGVLPSEEHMTIEERLRRYYTRICLDEKMSISVRLSAEQRLKRVKKDAKEWQNYAKKSELALEMFYDELTSIFGLDPRHRDSLVAPARNPGLDFEMETLLHRAVAELCFKQSPEEASREDIVVQGLTDVELSNSPYRKLNLLIDESGKFDKGVSNEKIEPSEAESSTLNAEESQILLREMQWDWAELEESASYELYLLRWETVRGITFELYHIASNKQYPPFI
jgi:hypothetical protein